MPPIEWKTVAASVAGFSHQAEDVPCQDAYAVSCPIRDWFIGAVSDGAGSAAQSAKGARALCDGIVSDVSNWLLNTCSSSDFKLEEEAVRSCVDESIAKIREELEALEPTNTLAEFHSTLVGVIAGPSGGLFFHIGDGAACAMNLEEMAEATISPPENGEYANETYFFTEPHWREHLRLTAFDGRANLIVLMSDGVTPFALGRGAVAPHVPFLHPLSQYLIEHSREEGSAVLAATLGREAIRRITGDDKTLVWAFRANRDE